MRKFWQRTFWQRKVWQYALIIVLGTVVAVFLGLAMPSGDFAFMIPIGIAVTIAIGHETNGRNDGCLGHRPRSTRTGNRR